MTTVTENAVGGMVDQDSLDRIIAGQAGRPGALLGILQRLQDVSRDKYLPMDTLAYVAQRTGIPQSLVQLSDASLAPFRRGLAAVGLSLIPADADPSVELGLVRAWHAYPSPFPMVPLVVSITGAPSSSSPLSRARSTI